MTKSWKPKNKSAEWMKGYNFGRYHGLVKAGNEVMARMLCNMMGKSKNKGIIGKQLELVYKEIDKLI